MAAVFVRIVHVPAHWNSRAQCSVEEYWKPFFVKVPAKAAYLKRIPNQVCESVEQAKSVAVELLASYGVSAVPEYEVEEGG